MSQVVKHLSNKLEAQSSIPSTAKKKGAVSGNIKYPPSPYTYKDTSYNQLHKIAAARSFSALLLISLFD
jgi:hypothetical protein